MIEEPGIDETAKLPAMRRLTQRQMIRLARPVLGILLLSITLTAQRTWIVDASNGAGTNFTDLPAAFAAVADGDRVIVRRGHYHQGRLNKAIQLVSDPGAIVDVTSMAGFKITGIGAGKTCVIEGLQFQDPKGFLTSVSIENNAGLIVLANVRVALLRVGVGLVVSRTRALTMTDSRVAPQLNVVESELSATRCVFAPYPGATRAGISAKKSRLELSQCSSQGSHGGGHAPGKSAIVADATDLVIRGDGGSSYVGGLDMLGKRAPSICGSFSSRLLVDPAVVLQPAPVNLLSIRKQRLPALYAGGGKLNATLDIEMFSPAGHAYVLAVALPTAPFDLPFGRQWLNVPSELFLVSAVQGPIGSRRHSFKVPNNHGLRGLALGFQALSVSSVSMQLTNPVIPVLH